MRVVTVGAAVLAGYLGAAMVSSAPGAAPEDAAWNSKAAAAYLDARQSWWLSLPNAARDLDTACVSCHTTLSYALARPALRSLNREPAQPDAETKLLQQVVRRVRAWKDAAPYYPDQTHGLPKTAESRGTEAILNAVILSRRDAAGGALAPPTPPGPLSDDARLAFSNLWALQMRRGELAGAWAWLEFGLEPWEGAESAYFGATLAAVAVGMAPGGYASDAGIQDNVRLLREHLLKHLDRQPTFNRLMLLWAANRLPGLLSSAQRDAIVIEALGKRGSDGGWSLSSLGAWKRIDGSAIDTASDGYATGLATFALQQAGRSVADPEVRRGLQWLTEHQDRVSGHWSATSLNKKRDIDSVAGRFMNDAATAYAVLALTNAQ
jgi:squalene-hopene/tetraprenyl-beta-curcumene cyclase